MALEKKHTIFGPELDGYYRVSSLNVQYKNGFNEFPQYSCEFTLEGYLGPTGIKLRNEEDTQYLFLEEGPAVPESINEVIGTYEFAPTGAMDNGFEDLTPQAYEYLKSLEAFSDATDH
jgi:hypothetical protein